MKRILLVLVLFAALGGAAAAYVFNQNVDSPLSGQSVGRDIANRRPIAVMLDNLSPDARPQSGLDRADLVFETLAEGGITRFMAVYQSQNASMIGPVRSTRLYYNSWAAALHVIFGHDGGNVDAVQQLPGLSTIYNEDADRITGPFWRISTRAVPHNEYTSTDKLRAYAAANGGSTTGIGMTIPHKNDSLPVGRPGRSYIHVQFSYGDYNVEWAYDPGSNDYLRSMGGVPHVEATTGKQLRAKNVVVMFTDETPASDPFTAGAIHMRTEGTGKATVYQDGTAIQGTWSKSSVDAPLQWLNASGGQIALNRGPTWVEVVPTGNSVTVTSTP